MKNFELISFASADELAARAASAWLDEIAAANHAARPHCVALSGGRIALKFFTSVVAQTKAREISLGLVHFFWADERCVPPDDAESNFRAAHELLFAPLRINDAQIHRIHGEDLPELAAQKATTEISSVVPKNPDGQPVLDLIFLGMGEDGHVASLFPTQIEGTFPKAIFCAIRNSPKPPPDRVSLSYAAIAAAREVWVLASGAGKEAALRESFFPNGKTPLAQVIQSRPQTKIFTDFSLD
ncbi:MAG TPA: 6-phosphogluconolactonase [Verrucomicrobiae bacterium]|jgi:6-phosphogluconolactonase|nr:6-phosphogluconolactonase [Verrucomicrobiae bacterium]